MKQIQVFDENTSTAVFAGTILALAIVFSGCCTGLVLGMAGGLRNVQGARRAMRHYTMVKGEEKEDFIRLDRWLAERGGGIARPNGERIYWFNMPYWRCYSNENFVLVVEPGRFSEEYADIIWLSGGITTPSRTNGNVLSAFAPCFSWHHTNALDDCASLHMEPDPMKGSGAYGIFFGDGRDRLVTSRHRSPLLLGSGKRAGDANETSLFFQPVDRYHTTFCCEKSRDGRIAFMRISISDEEGWQPSLGLHQLENASPLSFGSFEVDWPRPYVRPLTLENVRVKGMGGNHGSPFTPYRWRFGCW